MQRTKKSVSITMILAIISLACLLLCSLGVCNAWFTSSGVVQIDVNVSGVNAYVYQTQNSDGTGTSTKINAKAETPTYINLSGEIKAETQIPVYLQLRNQETEGMYLRFKFDIIILNKNSETKIPTTEIVESSFVKNGDYYYFMNGENQALFSDENIMLIKGFSVSAEDLETNNAYGQSIKIVLSVEFSEQAWTIS